MIKVKSKDRKILDLVKISKLIHLLNEQHKNHKYILLKNEKKKKRRFFE